MFHKMYMKMRYPKWYRVVLVQRMLADVVQHESSDYSQKAWKQHSQNVLDLLNGEYSHEDMLVARRLHHR